MMNEKLVSKLIICRKFEKRVFKWRKSSAQRFPGIILKFILCTFSAPKETCPYNKTEKETEKGNKFPRKEIVDNFA